MTADLPKQPSALLVATDGDLREVIGELFRQEGYATTAVATLHEARLALRESPTVLVIDVAFDGALEATFLRELAGRADAPRTILCLGAPHEIVAAARADMLPRETAREPARVADRGYRLLTVPRPFDIEILFQLLTEARKPA